ncbi:MAG: PEP-CTERM system TPR-repeat protein PrsT, partial [Methylococcaceae bacterium]|nr:PEP-CTERM system TPR-repeat protein PrsT [Methylococcaceae bacterium]
EQAIAAINRLKQKSPPSDTLPSNLLALVSMGKGENGKARETLEDTLRQSAGDLSASINLAQLAIGEKKYADARRLYQGALEKHPHHLSTQLKVVGLDGLEGKYKNVISQLIEIVRDNPEALEPRLMLARYYLRFGEPKKTESLLDEIRGKHLENADVLMVLTESQLEQQRYPRALETAKALLAAAPDSAMSHYLLARAYYENKDFKNMRPQLEQTLRIDPKFFLSRLVMVRLQTAEKQYPQARQILDELEKEYPNEVEVYTLKAWFALELGKPKEALQAYRKAYAIYPSSETVTQLARALWAEGDKNNSLQCLQDWLKKYPQDLDRHYLLAKLYTGLGRAKDARDSLEQALRLNPNNVVILNDLAWLLRNEDPGRALELAELAAVAASRSVNIMDTLAMVALEAKQYDKALSAISKAVDLAPENPTYRYHQAIVLERTGKTEMARDLLRELLMKHKGFASRDEAESMLGRLEKSSL